MSYYRKIFSDTLIYGIGNVLNRFIGVILLPVYTYYLTPAEYGVFSLIYAFWFFVIVFYLFGLETSFQKYFLEAESDVDRSKIYSTVILYVLCVSLFLSIILFLNSPLISRILTGSEINTILIRILCIILILDSISRFPMLLINSLQHSKVFSLISVSGVIINVLANIFFIVSLNMGVKGILLAFIISYFYTTIVSFFFTIKYFSFYIDKKHLKTLLKFGNIFLYYGLFLISLDLIDRFILEYFKGEESVGIYSACYRIGMIMNLAVQGFRTAWFPFFMNLKDVENNKKIFSKIFSYYCYAGLFIFLFVILFVNEFISIKVFNFSFLNYRYTEGLIILPYILFSYFFFGMYSNLFVASFFENKVSFLLISSGTAFSINIILNFLLIPLYSITGAAISTLISYGVMFAVLYFMSQKVYHIPYEWKRIVLIFLLTIVLYFLNIIALKNLFSGVLLLLLKIITILILPTVLFGFGFLNFKKLKAI